MSPRQHDIPAETFAALATGGGDAPAVRQLAAPQRSKRLLLIRAVLDQARMADTEIYRPLLGGYRKLAQLESVSAAGAAAVEAAVSYPAVGAWATSALRALVHPGRLPVEPSFLESLAATAALRAGIPMVVRLPILDGRIRLPSLGTAEVGQGTVATVRCGPDGMVIAAPQAVVVVPSHVPGRALASWRPLLSLESSSGGMRLTALLDSDDSWIFADRNPVRVLAESEVATWRRNFNSAWSLLVEYHPAAAREIASTLSVVVPLSTPPSGSRSATSVDAFGAVALSEQQDSRRLAATLVHEVQHAKLGALLDIAPLLQGPDPARWYASWRDDPRPLSGLLQGAYAHLGAAGFWRRVRWLDLDGEPDPGPALDAHTEFALWSEGTWDAIRTLQASGALTPAGRRFVSQMAETVRAWRREPLPAAAAAAAGQAADEHRQAWQARNGALAQTL